MSGIPLFAENINDIVEQIKTSQKNVLKAFQDHNELVNNALSFIQKYKFLTKYVKVKDPLEEIKKIKEEIDNSGALSSCQKDKMIETIICLLELYDKAKISASFKEIFLSILNTCLHREERPFFLSKELKEKILSVRDIRWLLIEMEKHPQYFQFTEEDLERVKKNEASRDNIYLFKQMLKKDGEYKEMYPPTEGGKLKCYYHMTGGYLDGYYKEFYKNGSLKMMITYKNGLKHGYEQFFNEKGVLLKESNYNYGNLHGEYKEWDYNEVLRKREFYNNLVVTMDESYFRISQSNYLCCNIKEFLVVLFYTTDEPFLEEFKTLPKANVVYGVCNISENPSVFEMNENCQKPFESVPSIYIYYKGSPFVQYNGEMMTTTLLETINTAYTRLKNDK